jgi:predicted dehydrogenase
MQKLRAAIIGLGVGEQHIAGYRRHPACEVVALCDLSPDKRDMARTRYPDMRVVTEAEAILEDPGIDIVSVASFDNFHATQVIGALEHGKHVFVEKPLCLHEEELLAIRAAHAARPRLKLSSNLILRKCPRFLQLRERIGAGDFGRLYYVETDYNYGRLHKIVDGWRGRLPFYSVVHGGGVHLIDLLLWLTGERPVEVTAYGNQIASQGSDFHNHDLVVALARFESGLLAKIGANFGCIHPHFHAVNVYGTRATFLNGVPTARLFRSADPSHPPELIDTPYPRVHKGDFLYRFVDAILTDTDPEVPAEEVFAGMSVSLAIEQASHQAGPVAVRYL